jgi:hypothetical protein
MQVIVRIEPRRRPSDGYTARGRRTHRGREKAVFAAIG